MTAAHTAPDSPPRPWGPLLTVPWVAVTLVLLGWAMAPALLARLMFAPLLLSVVLLGIPHGALDHLVPSQLGWTWAQRPARAALYVLAYAALTALGLLLWRWAPQAAYWLFLLVSWLHWGQGDLHFWETCGRRRPARWSAPVAILARGALPIAVPLLVWPGWFERLAHGAARAFGGSPVHVGLTHALHAALLMLVGALLLLYALDSRRASARIDLELGEAALLLALFVCVPAPLAIGVYFTLWHAWRHLGRLLVLRPADRAAVARGAPRRPLFRLARDLLPVSLVALALLAGLWCWAAPRVHEVEPFAALYLSLIAALTLPHALLVAVMDLPPDRARRSTPAGTAHPPQAPTRPTRHRPGESG